jgi:hypothetical protein
VPLGLNSIVPALSLSVAPLPQTSVCSTSRSARSSTCPCSSELSLPNTCST